MTCVSNAFDFLFNTYLPRVSISFAAFFFHSIYGGTENSAYFKFRV